MDDLDATLAVLAQAPVPAGLDQMDDRIFARIAARSAGHTGTGLGGVTIAAALVMGVVSTGFPAQQAVATSPLSPLGPVAPLVPSALLVEP